MKKLIIILLLSPLTMLGQMGDKTKHKIAGHVISMGVGIGMYKITKKPVKSAFVGFAVSILATLGKEAFDKSKGGKFDFADIGSGVWGATVGTVCLVPIFDITEKRRKERELKLM